MQQFAVIGLGRFGSRLASSLAMSDQEVIAIDKDPRLVDEMRDRVTLAVCLDATDEQALKSQGIDHVDVAVVGIGDNFHASVLVTVLLKQLGVPRVISRAASPTEATILTKVGADQVLNPEDEAADRWSNRLVSPRFLSQFELGPGVSLVELAAPSSWVGKSLAQLDLRRKLGLHVVAVKRGAERQDEDASADAGKGHASGRSKQKSKNGGRANSPLHLPEPGESLQAEDVLLIMGDDGDLARLPAEA